MIEYVVGAVESQQILSHDLLSKPFQSLRLRWPNLDVFRSRYIPRVPIAFYQNSCQLHRSPARDEHESIVSFSYGTLFFSPLYFLFLLLLLSVSYLIHSHHTFADLECQYSYMVLLQS
jgi:hypothetical protein